MQRKKIIEILIHIIFWIITFYFFIDNSYLRFKCRDINIEYVSIFLIVINIYINLFYLIPKLFNKEKFISYFLSVFFSTFIISTIEYLLIRDDIFYYTFNLPKDYQIKILYVDFFGILFRDSLFVAFFTMFKIYKDAITSHRFFKEKTLLEKQNLMVEIKMLKSKINTHFLFNTLNNLYVMSLKSAPETPNMILNLTDLMDYVVVESEKERISIEKEIEFINNYIALERIRHRQLDIAFDYDTNLFNIKIAPMIFESFVNNAFKYTKNDGTGYIKVKIKCFEGGKVIFSCINNKIQNTESVVSRGKGMKNTLERLEMVYKDKHLLNIENNDDEFIVNITLETI